MNELYARVYGRVQLVMFRDFVYRKARALALVGQVRNMDDGSVEVVAQGPRDDLEVLLKNLHKGPLLANVLRVDAQWRSVGKRFETFEIVF